MKYFFPQQELGYLQTNLSDRLGSIWSSFNLDFKDKPGTMKLANKLVNNTTSSDNVKLGLPVAFEYFNDKWWSVCGNYIFRTTNELLTSSFSLDTTAYSVGSSTTQFDITRPGTPNANTTRYTFDGTGTNPVINVNTFPVGATVETYAQNFSSGNKGIFTITASGSNYFEVTNTSGVAENDKTIGTGWVGVNGGSIEDDYDVKKSDLKLFNNRLWATADDELYSQSLGSSLWIKRDTLESTSIHKMTYLKKYNHLYFIDDVNKISSIDSSDVLYNTAGDYFIDINDTSLIISTIEANSQDIWIGTKRVNTANGIGSSCYIYQWDGLSSQITKEYKIDSAGILAITIKNDIPYVIDTDGRILEYTGYSFKEIQRFPLSKILLKGVSDGGQMPIHFNGFINTPNDTLLIAVNNLNVDDSTINENFQSGVWELDLSNRNLTHKHSFNLKGKSNSTITDYGQNKISAIGALKLDTLGSYSTLGRSTLLVGATYFTDATTTKTGIFINSPQKASTDYEGQKRGYFITTWFNSNEITDTFTRLWTIYKKFLNSTDKMIFKYRVNDEAPIEATITWTSTSTFTTTTDVSAYVGYEVEVLQGTGSGSCTHISTITELAGTYTVTLDTAITGVTGTAKARFQKWIKLLPEITGQELSYGQCPIIVNDTRIQIKGVLEWTGDNEFHKLVVQSENDININS